MEDINKKIRGNAKISYFMIGVCILLLFNNKDPNISHPFVKSHVKSAFVLHIILAGVFFIMSYPFLDTVQVYNYSLNSIITASIASLIFAGMLHGMYMAHKGKTVTLGEIFKNLGISSKVMQKNSSQEVSEDAKAILMTAHIPFIGYIVYPENKNIPHMRDIVMLNFLVTSISLFVFIVGYSSLASLIILGYTIWSVFSGVKLVTENNITTPNLDYIPTVREKYILQKSGIQYLYNTLTKKPFISFGEIVQHKINALNERKKMELSGVGSPRTIFLRNTIMLSIIFIISLPITAWNSKILLLFLLPLFFLIGYKNIPGYMMPYVYDCFIFTRFIYRKTIGIFFTARKLQKTNTKETISMQNNKVVASKTVIEKES